MYTEIKFICWLYKNRNFNLFFLYVLWYIYSYKIILILGNNYYREAPTAISSTQRESTEEDIMVRLELIHNKQCMFCKHKEIDELKYGLLYKLNDVVVHYYCIVSVLWIILYNFNFWSLNMS